MDIRDKKARKKKSKGSQKEQIVELDAQKRVDCIAYISKSYSEGDYKNKLTEGSSQERDISESRVIVIEDPNVINVKDMDIWRVSVKICSGIKIN